MVSPTATWLLPHIEIYQRMLDDLAANPPTGPLTRYLSDDLPAFFARTMAVPHGYAVDPHPTTPGRLAVVERDLKKGDAALYWDGSGLTQRPFDPEAFWMRDYREMATRIIALAAELNIPNPTIVDLGAGTCTQALALREAGSSFPVINLDFFQRVLKVGRAMSEALDVPGLTFRQVDLSQTLESPSETAALRNAIMAEASGPIIVVSRKAVHPFYSEPEYKKLFKFVFGPLNARAGIHLEMCGHLTPAFETIRAAIPANIPTTSLIGNKLKGETGDPFAYLEGLSTIKVRERVQLWPHYLVRQFPSLLSWVRR